MSDKKPLEIDTDEQRVSYGFGLQFGQQLMQNHFEGLDIDAVFTAMHHMVAGHGSQISEHDLNTSYEKVQEGLKEKAKNIAEQALAEGKAYLTENATAAGVTVTESGLQYKVLEAGSGADGDTKPGPKSVIRCHYHGQLLDGTVFDSSVERDEPAEFGVNEVIPGWTEVLQLMPVGSKWQVTVPPPLAYGPKGVPPTIAPHSCLKFEIELIAIIDDESDDNGGEKH